MTHAHAITDGDIVLAAIDVVVPPQRAFDALISAEVERWWGNAPGLYRMRNWQSDPRVSGRWRVDVCFPDGAAAR